MEGIVTALVLLACPVGMGLMMLITSRGMRDRQASRDEPSIDDLRAERRRVAAKIERLGVEGDAPDRARGVGASS